MKLKTTTLAALTVCALFTAQSQANLTWQGGNGNWFTGNWTNGVTSNLAWSGSVAYIGDVGAAPNPITLNGWLAVELHTYNGGYLNPNGNGLTGSIHVEDSSRFDIVGNNPHTDGLTLAKGRLQLGYGGNYTPVGGNMVVNAGNLQLASQAASGKTIAGNLFVNGGSVDYQFNNQIGDTAFIYARGGTINMGAKSDTVGGLELSSGSVISNGKLTSASTYDVRKGTISAELAGSVGLTKSTADTVTLSGANTYTGTTTVNNGTLAVDGSTAAGSAVSVGGASATGTPTLSGIGTVNGPVTIHAASGGAAGNLNPGTVGTIGTLNTGTATLNGTLAIDINASTSDKLVVTGDLDLTDSSLAINELAVPAVTPYIIATYTGALNGSFAPPSGYTLNYVSGSPNSITLTKSAVTSDYDTWMALYPSITAPSDKLPGADPDGDGLTNQQEYAFGLIPNSGASVNPITSPLSKTTGKFSYTRRDTSLLDPTLNYSVWYSTDMVTWAEDTGVTEIPTLNGEVETVEVTLSPALLSNPKLFIQVRAN